MLRGSVDLIEHRADFDVLRVTDHKTGKNRSNPDLDRRRRQHAAARALQPGGRAGTRQEGLRKAACSTARPSAVSPSKPIPINDYTRGQGLQVLDHHRSRRRAAAFSPAAPAERACTWCDFRPVCGPREEERVQRKARDRLADLEALRGRCDDGRLHGRRARGAIANDLDDTLDRRGGRRHRQDHRAREPDPARARDRTSEDGGDRRRHVHREGRRRAEASSARRAGARARDVGRYDASPTRSKRRSKTLEEAHVNTIHGFCAELLRERPVEARVDPLFAVLTEPQADRLYDARVSRLAAGGAEESAGRRAPRAAAIERRRRSALAVATTAGPIGRLRRRRRAAGRGPRLSGTVGPPAVESRARDRAPCRRRCTNSPPSPRRRFSKRDNLFIDTRCGSPSEPADSGSSSRFGDARSRRMGSAARSISSAIAASRARERERLQIQQRGHPHRRPGRARRALQRPAAVQEEWRTPISPPASSRSSPPPRSGINS